MHLNSPDLLSIVFHRETAYFLWRFDLSTAIFHYLLYSQFEPMFDWLNLVACFFQFVFGMEMERFNGSVFSSEHCALGSATRIYMGRCTYSSYWVTQKHAFWWGNAFVWTSLPKYILFTNAIICAAWPFRLTCVSSR